METFFYQAECGDAARIRYIGTDGKPHNIFIDSGYDSTFDHVLSEEIQKIRNAGEIIDLWIISHIHDDHIGGVLEYKNSVLYGKAKDIVDKWYYNPPRASVKLISETTDLISSAKSIKQGDGLTEFLAAINKLPNTDITSDLPQHDLYGLKITILAPRPTKLDQLRNKYSLSKHEMLEHLEQEYISDAKAAKNYDYKTKISDFILAKWKEDKSIENGSGISILSEFEGKKVLWLADSHPSDIALSLGALGYTKSTPLICNYVKVSHHGSKGNNLDMLYNIIQCNHYIMSVDGKNKHYLPNKECLARILRNVNRPKDSHYHFYFTYDNKILRSIFNIDDDNVYESFKFSTHFLNDGKWIFVD